MNSNFSSKSISFQISIFSRILVYF
uniref:Uncharacterized protein n=1 Tax=Rhizophora mucronata TaxID=61149 RepID=A0A2P2PFW4_RHIMU